MGKPLEVLRGPITGLPLPASSEIVIEGEASPPSEEARATKVPMASGRVIIPVERRTGDKQPIIRVKAIYHRNDPILEDEAPLWPGAVKNGPPRIPAGVLWDQLQSAGIRRISPGSTITRHTSRSYRSNKNTPVTRSRQAWRR